MFKANCFKHERNSHLLRLAEDLSSDSVGSMILVSGLISPRYLSTPKQVTLVHPLSVTILHAQGQSHL